LVILNDVNLEFALSLLLEPQEKFLRNCVFENYQGKGPGGQKRNRVKSGVRASLKSTRLSVTADNFRETKLNKNSAYQKLRLALALSFFTSESLANNLLTEELSKDNYNTFDPINKVRKIFRDKVSPNHHDFCLCIFLILTTLLQEEGNLKQTAESLGVSSSRMIKLLVKDKQSFEAAQRIRYKFDKLPIKIN